MNSKLSASSLIMSLCRSIFQKEYIDAVARAALR